MIAIRVLLFTAFAFQHHLTFRRSGQTFSSILPWSPAASPLQLEPQWILLSSAPPVLQLIQPMHLVLRRLVAHFLSAHMNFTMNRNFRKLSIQFYLNSFEEIACVKRKSKTSKCRKIIHDLLRISDRNIEFCAQTCYRSHVS